MDKKKVLKRGLAAGLVAAALAAVFAFTPTGAQAAKLLTGADIKDQSIQSRDIAAEGVGASEVRNRSLTGTDIRQSTVDRFLKGEQAVAENDDQDAKISDLEDRVEAEEAEGDTVGLSDVTTHNREVRWSNGAGETVAPCPTGKVAIGGGFVAESIRGGVPTVTQSAPVYVPGDASTSWSVKGTSQGESNVKAWVVCASVN